jgi:hypothetical protein
MTQCLLASHMCVTAACSDRQHLLLTALCSLVGLASNTCLELVRCLVQTAIILILQMADGQRGMLPTLLACFCLHMPLRC